MLLAQHEILSARPSGMTPRRALIVGGVAMLHVAAIYALINGMAGGIAQYIPPDLKVKFFDTATPTKPDPTPPQPPLAHPTLTTEVPVTPPVVNIENPIESPITTVVATPSNPPPADSGAAGLASTHTTPPYPTEARAQAHQGTVLLQMTVSPQGDVVSATVVQTSGFAELDQAAVSWVQAHWKYKPAVQGGVAVTSQIQAFVKFDLKQARG